MREFASNYTNSEFTFIKDEEVSEFKESLGSRFETWKADPQNQTGRRELELALLGLRRDGYDIIATESHSNGTNGHGKISEKKENKYFFPDSIKSVLMFVEENGKGIPEVKKEYTLDQINNLEATLTQ